MSIPNAPRSVLRYPLILAFYLPSVILAFSSGLLAPILPLYAKSFEVSYGLIGLMLAGDKLGMLIGDVPAGVLSRRLGQKRAMLLGAGCTALSTIALVWASSIPEVVVYRVLAGFGAALLTVARHAYVAENVTVASRGRAIALFGGISRVGRFAGPTVGGIVAAQLGLRVPFLVYGGATVLVMAVIASFVHVTQATTTEARPHGNHLVSALKGQYRTLASAGAGQLFAQMIRAGRQIVIPLYGADVIGLDVQAIGFIVSISSAVDMTLFYPTGLIMDRLGRKFAIVPSFLIQALGMALVPFTGSFVGLLLATSLIGFGNGLSSGSMMTLGADLAPQDVRGEFLGLWRLIGDVGSTGAPLIVGSVADILALAPATWVMSGAGVTAATIFLFLVPETLKKRPRPAKVLERR
jgi:MFS family permease